MSDRIDFKQVAAQLAHPEGEMGIRVAAHMNQSNRSMTLYAIELLRCQTGHQVLEIGPGNAYFAKDVLAQAKTISYYGLDISDTMVKEGERLNRHFIDNHQVTLKRTDGNSLPFANQQMDRVFAVNTIYFWKKLDRMLIEIRRVLKPGGYLCVAFADRKFMQALPFTNELFRLYTAEEIVKPMEALGFSSIQVERREHPTTTSGGTELLRHELFICAQS